MMKKLLFLFLLSILGSVSFAQDFPAKPGTLVNDYAGALSASQKQSLEQKLVAFDDSSSTQIAIAIVKSVGEYDINDYTQQLGRKWGVGHAGKNNGIMIVVAVGDRKISIQTGYGVEGALPDVYSKRIIENDIKPNFKTGDYYAGLDAGTTSIIKYTRGEYKNDQPKVTKDKDDVSIIVIIIIVIVIVILVKKGGGGGNSEVIGGRGASNALFWAMLFGSGGGGRGGNSGWGGGGSSGGGGFGGFGGGSFGGGGSSGSW